MKKKSLKEVTASLYGVCSSGEMGLGSAERVALTNFTMRAFQALAHLREAWLVADDWDRRHVELCLKELLASKSMQEHRDTALKVLRHTLDMEEANTLMNGLYPMPWSKS